MGLSWRMTVRPGALPTATRSHRALGNRGLAEDRRTPASEKPGAASKTGKCRFSLVPSAMATWAARGGYRSHAVRQLEGAVGVRRCRVRPGRGRLALFGTLLWVLRGKRVRPGFLASSAGAWTARR
jgi:hypothetical protein